MSTGILWITVFCPDSVDVQCRLDLSLGLTHGPYHAEKMRWGRVFLLKASGANPQSDGIHLAKWWHFPWIWCWTYMNFTWRQRSFKWLLKILRPSSSKEIHMKKLPMPFVIWPSKMGTAEVTLKSSVPSRSWDTNVAREFSKSIIPQFGFKCYFQLSTTSFWKRHMVKHPSPGLSSPWYRSHRKSTWAWVSLIHQRTLVR